VPRIQSQFSCAYSSLGERLAVVGIVVLLHLAVFAVYRLPPQPAVAVTKEMSISFALAQVPQAEMPSAPAEKTRAIVPRTLPVTEPVVKKVVAPVEQIATPTLPSVMPTEPAPQTTIPQPKLDTEPDFRADYLNNPRPPYPMVAKRMGYHGKVVLHVEVLAEGRAGQVLLQQSCGYDILDNSALQTIRSWKFSPAKHLGQPVTQWFFIPIIFSLEDRNA